MRQYERTLSIISGYDSLSPSQKEQFRRVVAEGLRGKFASTLGDDTAAMFAIIDIWIRHGFLPISRAFCAVEQDGGRVLSILLINDFFQPDPMGSLRCLLDVIRVIGLKKALHIAFRFLAIDNINKEPNPKNIVAEIYLVSTLASERGNGIGTFLLRSVLDSLHLADSSAPITDAGRCVKLLVFAKNPAIRLYERLGFIQKSTVETPNIAKAFGTEYDALVRMERPV